MFNINLNGWTRQPEHKGQHVPHYKHTDGRVAAAVIKGQSMIIGFMVKDPAAPKDSMPVFHKILPLLLMLSVSGLLTGCTSANKQFVEDHAKDAWGQAGFEVVGYQGYQLRPTLPFGYGGALVWYELRRKDQPGLSYEGALWRWGSEVHLYDIKARERAVSTITVGRQ